MRMEKACLISFGCGVTARALTDTKELTKIDVVDISKDILEMNSLINPMDQVSNQVSKRECGKIEPLTQGDPRCAVF